MRIIHQIMHFPDFRCLYFRFLGSVGISSMLGGGYAQIYMKTRGLRVSECCLNFSIHLLFSADVADPCKERRHNAKNEGIIAWANMVENQ